MKDVTGDDLISFSPLLLLRHELGPKIYHDVEEEEGKEGLFPPLFSLSFFLDSEKTMHTILHHSRRPKKTFFAFLVMHVKRKGFFGKLLRSALPTRWTPKTKKRHGFLEKKKGTLLCTPRNDDAGMRRHKSM